MPCITAAAVNGRRLQVQEDGGGPRLVDHTDVANEGNFVWEDGCTSEYTNWTPVSRRFQGPGADYAYMGYSSAELGQTGRTNAEVAALAPAGAGCVRSFSERATWRPTSILSPFRDQFPPPAAATSSHPRDLRVN